MTLSTSPPQNLNIQSLEEWIQNPPAPTEWVNDTLAEKNGMTLKHSRVQSKLSRW